MKTIFIGTTPTISYGFKIVAPSDFVSAELSIANEDEEVLLTKPLSEASVKETSIEWKLSQSETLDLGVGTCSIMLNWLTADGTRGVGKELQVYMASNQKKEVMT